jgi:protease IV
MKLFQRFILGFLLVSPIIIGILLAIPRSAVTSSSIANVGFKKLGLVDVNGVIAESETVVRELQELRDDNSIAGVILRIDSPGGAVAPSQEIYKAVEEFRKSDKPLIVSMGNVAASGGYYIACPAKKIFAAPGTLTGSIGVIMTVPLYKDLAKKIGIEMQTYKAGNFKDLASPYRTMSTVERKMIQDLLDDTHDQFISDVASARSIPRDSLVTFADGRIFTGRQALQRRLIDTLGSYDEACNYLRSITGLGTNARIINKRETSANIREWFVREMIRTFPAAYRLLSPVGLQCLTIIE